MASHEPQESTVTEMGSLAHDLVTSTQNHSSPSNAVESKSSNGVSGAPMATEEATSRESQSKRGSGPSFLPPGPVRMDTTTALLQAQAPPSPPPALPVNPIARVQSSAIGPPVDEPVLPAKDEQETGPSLQITLLLTNGARHPFKLDAKYLSRRNVEAQGNDPYNLSVYKLKELILREWREEWEYKPTNPSYIRLISFGRLLDDKAALKDQRFNTDSQNVVHMTIKPQDFVDEEDGGKGGKASYSGNRDGTEERSPGCRCIIM